LKISENLLSRALQECPNSGKLWGLAIEIEPAATRKAKSMDALKTLDNDSDIFIAVSKIFWGEKKPEKTRKWLKKAVALNKDNGDAWAHYFRFEHE
jgi:pre-mRNA-processing factor 6